MKSTTEIEANRYSLWSLLEKKVIAIPEYQREYAHGRQTGDTPDIRKSLIKELIGALIIDGKMTELNFVYGGEVLCEGPDGTKNISFQLVDGQQRLTTLFVFYWYVFMRAGEAYDRLNNFKYKTRQSSASFCEELLKTTKKDIDLRKDFSDRAKKYPECGDVSVGIREMTWFTGVMYSDPTVRSMLVVLDEIDQQFQSHTDIDWNSIVEKLKTDDENCPIIFLGLDMGQVLGQGEDAIRDLYIKMNSRGKLLTDFEIFKSLLSKKVTQNSGNFDLLAGYFQNVKIDDNNPNRVELISKFNCDYADAFFSIVDDGKIIDNTGLCDSGESNKINPKEAPKQGFDSAMMNCVNEIFRVGYVLEAVEKGGINRREYENYYNEIKSISGKSLFSWIEKSGRIDVKNNDGTYIELSLFENYDDAVRILVECFCKIVHLFALFSSRVKKSSTSNLFPDETRLVSDIELISDLKAESSSFQSTVRRYGLFLFWDVFFGDDIPEKNSDLYEAYKVWSHFVYNITYESSGDDIYKAVENIFQACRFFKKMINWLKEKPEPVTAELVYDAIIQNDHTPAVRFEVQFGEEQVKAQLMKTSYEWRNTILEAENYIDGSRVWSLLELSHSENGEYQIDEFKKWYELFKQLFNKDYTLKINQLLFERALLCMNDLTCSHTGHLEATDMYSFLGKDYRTILSRRASIEQSARHEIILSLLRKLVGPESLSLDQKLQSIIDSEKGSISHWKKAFVDNFVINQEAGGFHFRHGIMPDKNDFGDTKDESYTLLYTASKKRTSCAELYSFILAYKLKELGYSVYYNSAYYNESYYDENRFPRRYLILTHADTKLNLYYYNAQDKNGFFDGDGNFYGETVEDTIKKITDDMRQ